MSDFPFSIPRRGDADVVNGVSYAGDTLTLTRAEGSDLTTTIATSDPTKIENGTSKMEIASSDGACVFTPNGNAALKTTFAADGNVGINDTAPSKKLSVNGAIYVNGNDGIIINKGDSYASPGTRQWTVGNSNNSLQYTYVSSSASHPQGLTMTLANDGTLQIKGNIQQGSSGSDDRLKKDKAPLENATESIGKLSVQTYKKETLNDFSLLKRTGVFVSETGLIAQEVYYNAPEFRHLVSTGTIYDDDSGLHDKIVPNEMDLTGVPIGEDPDYEGNGWSKEQAASINYQGFISYLIKSNQELAERLAALENK